MGVAAGIRSAIIAALLAPGVAHAQRAAENAVATADDAFGSSVGLEQTGIYSESDTRGFSPVKAGNARIDGVYYDPVGSLSSRLRAGNTVRVGFAAESYPFQAPTGIIEYRFRPFPQDIGTSLGYNFMAYGGYIREWDFRLPTADHRFAVIGGAAFSDLRQSDGSSNVAWGLTARAIARFGGIEIAPFASYSKFTDNHAHPLVVVRGSELPRFPRKRLYLGQDWANGHYDNHQLGGVIKGAITDRLSLRGGLFYAQGDRPENYSEIFTVLARDGLAGHRLVADPFHKIRSTSGEMQFAYRLGSGRWHHRIIAGYRARNRFTQSGGSDVETFRDIEFGLRDPQPRPAFRFSRVNAGRVKQSAMMLGYLASLDGIGSINLGVQKARYRASAQRGSDGLRTRSRDDPWLYNATFSASLGRNVSAYVATQKGLEDSGVAPESAVNRNEQLPATRTRQYEAGVRFKLNGTQLVTSVFEITKPYFASVAGDIFAEVGKVRHRGVEASLAGHVGKRLNLLAGAVAMQPRVSGPAVSEGMLGKRPAGTPSLYAKIDANYRTDIFGGLTPTAALTYTGRRAVGSRVVDGRQLTVAGYAALDLGLRQQFRIGKVPASFRFLAYNVFDTKSWKVVAPNTIYMDERRRYNLTLTADF